jgi:hypothetical protein
MALGLLFAFGATGCDPDLGDAIGGPSADSVFEDLDSAGLPITDGVPTDPDYAAMVRENACEDSRSFVRTDSNKGWGIICIGLPASKARSIYDSFDGSPALLGPLYADAEDNEIIVFGFGWPNDASKLVHDALGDSAGTHLGF